MLHIMLMSRFATMLSSPIKTDGFQKLISVSDIQRLKTAAMREILDNFETLVTDSWELCCNAHVSGTCLERVFGKLCVRATLWQFGSWERKDGGREASVPGLA